MPPNQSLRIWLFDLKKLHTLWFRLYDILEKETVWHPEPGVLNPLLFLHFSNTEAALREAVCTPGTRMVSAVWWPRAPPSQNKTKESKWVSIICWASARQSLLCPSGPQWQPPSLRTPNKPNMPSHSHNSALYYYLKVNTFINRPLTRVVDNLRALLCKQ